MAAHKLLTLVAAVLCFLLYQVATIPWFGVPGLKDENPEETALMRQRIGEAKEQGRTLVIRHSWVPLPRLPKHLVDAIIVAEDGTFYEHSGFDWFEVRESLEKNLKQRRAARGGSTITQQLAKNLYLSTSKDPLRKAREAVITLLLERHLSKQRILELYVNVIEWGDGVFGVDAAARRYFARPASALTFEQSLRLAAVIPSPLRHRPDVSSRYVTRRAEIIRRRMQGRRYVPFPEELEVEERVDGEAPMQAVPDTSRAGFENAGAAGAGDAGGGGGMENARDAGGEGGDADTGSDGSVDRGGDARPDAGGRDGLPPAGTEEPGRGASARPDTAGGG
jgi:monofunctional biosynthetic peptidoglycan transglycosylase